jgi:hypothetical protein
MPELTVNEGIGGFGLPQEADEAEVVIFDGPAVDCWAVSTSSSSLSCSGPGMSMYSSYLYDEHGKTMVWGFSEPWSINTCAVNWRQAQRRVPEGEALGHRGMGERWLGRVEVNGNDKLDE